ncbi:hypothetical protein JB92DRAFT_2690359, partial [Gautieria morchelliformis]
RFDLEHFLPAGKRPGAPDPSHTAFGFGRRICPGWFFAEDSLWIAATSILHVFHIAKPKDADGRNIEADVHWSSGLVSVPSPFLCDIKPRFEGAANLISSVVIE